MKRNTPHDGSHDKVSCWRVVFVTAGRPPVEAPGRGLDEPIGKTRPRVFRIHVVEEGTGRGVPLVELRTVNQIRYVTDSNGIVAFDEPGLFNRKVFFTITQPWL